MAMTVFVIILLTAFCVRPASFHKVFYFVKDSMTWKDAAVYCSLEYTDIAKIQDEDDIAAMMKVQTGELTDKAWIGLYENASEWTWVDGQAATYYNWSINQPDNLNANEFCVSMNAEGDWSDDNCLDKRSPVCFDGDKYFLPAKGDSWSSSKTHCEARNADLVQIPDDKTNSMVQTLSEGEKVWIGLSRPNHWYWLGSGKISTFQNWQYGQPDNMNHEESCAAMVVKDGTWTDELCSAKYPVFCYRDSKRSKKVVKIKIQSSANMEDPVASANLLKKLAEALAKKGLTDFKLTWKKLPAKQTKQSDSKDVY